MKATKHATKKTEDGAYIYRGREIYRVTESRTAFNPWHVGGSRRTFATLAAAKEYVDSVAKE